MSSISCRAVQRHGLHLEAISLIWLAHQTGRACWLFEVPHVGYMAGNQHEITNVWVTNMRHYAGWLFQITNMRQLRMLVTSNNQHAPTCGPFACWLFQITNMRQLRMLDTSNNQHAKGPQVGLRMLVILFQLAATSHIQNPTCSTCRLDIVE